MARTYDRFHVIISVKGLGTCLVRAKSKIGNAEAQTRLPFAEDELKEKLHRFALVAEGKATPAKDELREFGQELYKMLFHDAVWDLVKKATRAAEHADGLLIELEIQSPKLNRIPWELLHDETDFLALSRRTPVVRSVPTPQSESASEVKPIELPVRILFAAAKPHGVAPLNLGRQIRQIYGSLRKAMEEGAAVIHPALGDEVQSARFLAAIRDGGYHILHISTHGAFSEQLQKGFILLEDGTGHAAPVAISALAEIVRDTSIQLAYLDACQTGISSTDASSEGLSEILIRSGVRAVIAMQFSIRDDLATAFSKAFYRNLLAGEPIWYSVTEARIFLQDLLGRETIDWAIPALYLRDGYTPSITGTKQPSKRYYAPHPPARFVGREIQLDELAEKLLQPSARSVVVHGFGGIGKSTLIEKLLSEIHLLFQDTCCVDCRGIGNILAMTPQANSMLSIHGLPLLDDTLARLNESGKIEYLVKQLDQGEFLLALDNIDEMQGRPSTTQFFSLVNHCVNIKILASCRIPDAPLGHQRLQRIDALEEQHAISLIREVGHDIPQIRDASDFDLRRVNEKLRGHPLSIVIATPYFDFEPFETALKDLPTRVGSNADIVQGILEWSYSKLSPEEQRFLENASVFYGQVPMGALLDINDGKDRDVLAKLVRKNMIEFSRESDLHSLHPLLREYAYSRLSQREDFDQIQIKAAEKVAPRCLGAFWSEALRLYQLGVDSARRTKDDETLASMLTLLGSLLVRTGEYGHAASSYNESLEIERKLGNQSGIAATLHQLAMIEQDKGNYDEAKRLYYESLEIERKLGNQSGIAATLGQLANMEYSKGNYDEAKKLYDQIRDAFEKLGDQSGIAATLHNLAMIEEDKGNYDEAKELCDQGLEIKRRLGDQSGIAATLHQLASIEEGRGNYDEAKKLYDQSLTIHKKLGDQSGIAATLQNLGVIGQDKGNYDEAKKLYDQSLTILQKLGDQSGIAATLHQLATIEQIKGNYDEALRLYNESLAIERKLGDQLGIATTLGALGRLAEDQKDLDVADKYYEQALQIFEKLGAKPYKELVKKGLERVRKLKQKP